MITRGGRAVGQAGGQSERTSALNKKLTDEFCLFFTDMTFWHEAISGHFSRWPPKKLVATITYEPLVQIWHDLGISDDLINFWDESIKNKIAAAAI